MADAESEEVSDGGGGEGKDGGVDARLTWQ